MSGYDYDVPKPTGDVLTQLSALGNELDDAQTRITRLQNELKKAQEAERHLREEALPELMCEVGMMEFKTSRGVSVSVADVVSAKIPVNRVAEAHKWLEDHAHGGLIKRKVTTEFNREQEEAANALSEVLRKRYPLVTIDKSVHTGSLGKWAREMLKAGEAFPHDLFGVYIAKVAKITKKKK